MNKKIGLFLAGGSIHTSFGAGYCSAVERYKKVEDIEILVGQSAGSFMACYLLAGNAQEKTKGYWEINHKIHFSLFHNIKKYKTPFFYKYLLRDMFLRDNPIENWETIISHPLNQKGKFMIQIYDAVRGELLFLKNFRSQEVILEAIVASCWLPILGGVRPYKFSKKILQDMTIVNLSGEIQNLEYLRTFDSYVDDQYLTKIMKTYTGEKYLVVNQHPSKNVYGVFGKYLKVFEWIASYIIFTPYFRSIRAYNRVITFGGANSSRREIFKVAGDIHSELSISHPPQGLSGWNKETFRKKAFLGYESCCKQWDINEVEYPEEWKDM